MQFGMTVDARMLIERLDEMGEEQVKLALVEGRFNQRKAKIAEHWLEERRQSAGSTLTKIEKQSKGSWKQPTLVVAIVMAIVTFFGVLVQFGAWRFPVAVIEAEAKGALSEISQPISSGDRIEVRRALILERFPELDSFKFALYSPPEEQRTETTPRGVVQIIESTKSQWTMLDEYGCSYPDQAQTGGDFMQGIAYSVCGFPSWASPANKYRDVETSTIQIRVHFFDTDRSVVENIQCACSYLYFRDPVFNVEDRTVEISLGGDAESIVISGYPKLRQPAPKQGQEAWETYPVGRYSLQYSEDWVINGFNALK
jgi:hypothetical protein